MYRKRLQKLLGAAADEEFLELIWATFALQSGHETAAAKILGGTFPREAATSDMTSKFAIHRWELETLTNEALTSPKQSLRRGELTKSLNCRSFSSIVQAVHLLRQLESQEYSVHGEGRDILQEMYRIAGRQFDWQRGYFNLPLFYRSAFIYGHERCTQHLMDTYGTSLDEMALVGFALYVAACEFPAFAPSLSITEIGLDSASLNRVLKLISCPIEQLRTFAREQREGWQVTAYRPSVLRRFPCISFRDASRFLCPLPELILERVTAGVYYDVVGGGGEIRHEYGRRFEQYALLYLNAQLSDVGAVPEWRYRFRKELVDTPDIIIRNDNVLQLAIECKASRMSFAARFAEEAVADRGYQDLVRGVFQLWRFFSHCRRGFTQLRMTEDTVGILLTLDSWLVMGGPVTREIVRRAHEMADEKGDDIIGEDRKPIIFCPITDFESVLADATEASFLEALKLATGQEYDGWMLSSVHEKIAPSQSRKPYPFDNMGDLLPWWAKIDEEKERRSKSIGDGTRQGNGSI